MAAAAAAVEIGFVAAPDVAFVVEAAYVADGGTAVFVAVVVGGDAADDAAEVHMEMVAVGSGQGSLAALASVVLGS